MWGEADKTGKREIRLNHLEKWRLMGPKREKKSERKESRYSSLRGEGVQRRGKGHQI